MPFRMIIVKAITKVGINAVNERETPNGTVSGILTTQLRRTQRK